MTERRTLVGGGLLTMQYSVKVTNGRPCLEVVCLPCASGLLLGMMVGQRIIVCNGNNGIRDGDLDRKVNALMRYDIQSTNE